MSRGAGDAEADAMREAARRAARALRARFAADDDELGWFEALYQRADGDIRAVPWAEAAPRATLDGWLAERGAPSPGSRAVDVGCGLGDNAAQLADAGWRVTAFDISPTAIAWAAQRFTRKGIAFHVADVFAVPESWLGRFDLVHEAYNLQAMPRSRVADAIPRIAALAAPGGTVLVMCRGRDAEEMPDGPPWPLSRADLDGFRLSGLDMIRLEEFHDLPVRHFLAEYRHPRAAPAVT